MAEATLNDVITRMKEEGLLTRNSGTNSLKSAISEIKGVRSDFKGFFNNFGSALQNLGSTQKEFSDMMKSNFEQQQEALATQQRNDTLSDKPKPTETDGTKGAISKLLASIKGLIPKKSPGLLGLLFGGVAAAMAFFPDWVKENLINPIIDVINVFQGEDATTTLGKVIEKVKGAFKFISDNFGEEAAWVLGITGALVALKPIATFKLAAGALSGLNAIGGFLTMPWIAGIVGIAALLVSAKLGLDKLRELSIETETELSKKALRAYKEATDPKERERIVEEQIARLKRNQDTTLQGVSSIEDPINEILNLNKDVAESAIKQARANKLALAVESDTLGGGDGSIDERINEENNKIAKAIRDRVIAITKGKAPTDENEIYNILKEFIEQSDAKETKAVIKGIKAALPSSFGELSGRLTLLNSLIKSGEDLSLKGMEKLNLALKGERLSDDDRSLRPEELNRSKSQERLENMFAGFDEMDYNMRGPIVPVVAPTTNNNDNKTINITNNNIFGGQTDPLEGLYSKLPTQ